MIERWKLGNYVFKYNPSTEKENHEIEALNSISVNGSFSSRPIKKKETKGFTVTLYQKQDDDVVNIEYENLKRECMSGIVELNNELGLIRKYLVQTIDATRFNNGKIEVSIEGVFLD